tara:strand:- start:206 stop:1039 length:834 start_codon:yes stop_codon:yes gene_type:complete
MRIGDSNSVITRRRNPLRFTIARILIRTGLCRFFLLKQKNYVLRFFPTPFSRELWINKEYQHTANIFFSDYLKFGDVVIDIGANIGTVTLESAVKVSSKGRVYSIEPDKKIFKFLAENIKLNNLQNIEIFNVALGEGNNSVFFSSKRSDDLNSVSITGEGEEISLCRLDDLSINESKINLIKIDVLGYEKFVFEGAKKILKMTECIHLPIIPSDCKRYGYDFNDIFEMLKNLGFQLFTFSEKNISAIKSNFNPKNQDVLAVKDLEGFLARTKYTLVK